VDPRSGVELRRWGSVPGFDVTFSAPKSVSVLFGIGDDRLRGEIRDAHDAAVRAAFGYLEREAALARRGSASRGTLEVLAGDGLVAAAFRHRTSRAGDPQLHTHVLVANLVQGPDGRWSALDARALYAHAKTAGYLYEAALRAELTRALGVEWTPVRNGIAEIAGVPAAVLRAFSRRRVEIEAAMERRGVQGARAARVAALDTRRAKDYAVTPDQLVGEWRERAATLGLTCERVVALLGRGELQHATPAELEAASRVLAGADGLTAQRSSFTRREVIQALCERLPVGASVADLEAAANAFLAKPGRAVPLAARDQSGSPEVGRRMDGRVLPRLRSEGVYSTPELLALEGAIIERAIDGRGVGAGVAEARVVQRAVEARPTLSGEQRAMVQRLTGVGDRVAVVVGRAGSGKTFALAACRQAWEESGQAVLGAAVARRAAAELEQAAGIRSTSVAALMADLRASPHALARGTVVVVDEAGMLPTRQLAELAEHVERASGKLVLVGDHRQLPEIEAGGAFRGLVLRGLAFELTQNRRQAQAWERDAVELLRGGQAREALDLYAGHRRLHLFEDADSACARMVADWYAAGDPAGTVMIAQRRRDVAGLNGRARAVLRHAGRLGQAELELPGGRFAVGDSVLIKRNDRRLDVRNGDRATIIAIDRERHALTVRADGRDVVLPARFLEARTERGEPTLLHGYAITAYVAQGMTCRRALVLGSDQLYQECGYTTMTRGREANHLYAVAPEPPERDEYAPAAERRPDPLDDLVAALERSEAHTLAHDIPAREELAACPTEALHAEADRLRAELRAAPSATGERRLAAVAQQREEVDEMLATASARRAELEDTRRGWLRRPHPELPQARAAEQLAAASVRELREHEHALRRAIGGGPAGWAREHADTVARYALVRDELQRRARTHARAVALDPPAYLLGALGARPDRPSRAAAWDRAALRIESFRAEHGVTHPELALGERPREFPARAAWEAARRELERTHRHLGRAVARQRDTGRGLG